MHKKQAEATGRSTQPLIRLLAVSPDEALIRTLHAWFDLPVCADIAWHAAQPAELVRVLAAVRPDVLLLEDPQGGQGVPAVMRRLRSLLPGTHALLMCDAPTDEMIVRFIKLQASGCLLKSMEPWLVAKAVRSVYAGDVWFQRAALLRALHSDISNPALAEPTVEEGLLTSREEEIFRLIGSALSNKEIARRLNISDNTVKTHLHRIYVKLNRSGRYKALLSQRRGGFSQISL